MDHRKAFGDRGEKLAADFFIRNGYDVIARNWRCGRMGELDLVVRRGNEVRAVEVKTRAAGEDGYPEDAVTDQKLARIADLVEVFATQKGIAGDIHIDVVAIRHFAGRAPEVAWLKDV